MLERKRGDEKNKGGFVPDLTDDSQLARRDTREQTDPLDDNVPSLKDVEAEIADILNSLRQLGVSEGDIDEKGNIKNFPSGKKAEVEELEFALKTSLGNKKRIGEMLKKVKK